MAGVANNLNQIARATNVTGQRAEEHDIVVAAVMRAIDRVTVALDRLTAP
jgi:hypothetical protein